MATIQVAPQQPQPPMGPGAFPLDPSPSSRRQYQHSPSEQSRSPPVPRGSPHSKRPSRRPSGGNPSHTSDIHTSTSTTPRVPDLPTTISPTVTLAASISPSYESQGRRRENTQKTSQPPFTPPPRTSSHHKVEDHGLGPETTLTDRSISQPDTQKFDDHQSSSRKTTSTTQNSSRGQIATLDAETGIDITPVGSSAQSRRRGPASPAGPQRAISTREPSATQSSSHSRRDRSTINVVSSPPSAQSPRNDLEVTNRVVVDDPSVDLKREQERQLESVPGLSNTTSPNIPSTAPRSRQDFSAQNAASSARRKETRFGEYVLGQTLGEGEFGKVKLGWKTDGSVQVAIKLIRRESLGTNPSRLPKINREIKILETLSHPNIVKLHEMVENSQFIGMVLEYASGGELFDYILNHRYLKDNTARKLFAQLVSGVGYLHKKGIVHRDLKLENLLLDRNRNIIITDFGFANTFDPRDVLDEETEYHLADRDFVKRMDLDKVRNGVRRGDLMATSCGSPCYAAPELVVTDSLYTGRKVDVWSCGVILYAMLAGYLPFDDDPENPDGDNINQLYKYITTTPLTFPEYVTPHARDLLRRILVADPRKRADLFEVARHSWLNDFAHVVAQVTSSTTTVGDIANTTVNSGRFSIYPLPDETPMREADARFAPGLVRSHSVREPTKTAPATTASPVGGLSHQGKIDSSQPSERIDSRSDSKRRTVQVEYVAPQKQTARGEGIPQLDSPASNASGAVTGRSRVRPGTDGVDSSSRGYPSTSKPLPADPRTRSEKAYYGQQNAKRSSQPPLTTPKDTDPPTRLPKDFPRSASDSTGAFAQPSTSYNRPTTGNSMSSTNQARLPSRGNSYSQPLAPTVAATNAHGRVTAPKGTNRYNISDPMPVDAYGQNSRPATQQYGPPPSLPSQPARSHKRANTLSNFFRTGSISVPKTQSQAQTPAGTPPPREKKHAPPPTSMKTSLPNENEPRPSTDSRRPSFNFSRRSRENSNESKPEKSRRFSLLPASFSFKSFTSAGGGKDSASEYRPGSERKQSTAQSRQPSRPQTMAYQSSGPTEGFDFGTGSGNGLTYDGSKDGRRTTTASTPRKNDYSRRGSSATEQNQYGRYQSQEQYTLGKPQLPPLDLATPSDSQASLPRQQQFQPVYPPGFGSEDQESLARKSVQQARPDSRPARGPAVLTKDRRRFADAYEQDAQPGSGPGAHAGSSGAAKRVMDFFRRRGKARAGE